MNKKGNILYAQSGGPTSVINSSAYGVIMEASLRNEEIEKIYVGKNGIQGILDETLIEIDPKDKNLELLKQTPGAAFGSCRLMLDESNKTIFKKIEEVFAKYNIKYFAYNGGNDSMDTVMKLSRYFSSNNIDVKVIGIPKTIDNDLKGTDHTPGFGSAAKYIASCVSCIAYDAKAYSKGRVNVIEIMGRDTGWLTASSSLANLSKNGPDLIYVPEVPFDTSDFLKKVKKIYDKKKYAIVCVSEGIKDKNGNFIGENGQKDAFGHAQLGGVATYLANLITQKLNIKTRGIELSLAQRSASFFSSKTDVQEAISCGREAVKALLDNKTGFMIGMKRKEGNKYEIEYTLEDIDKIGGQIKYLPSEYIAPNNIKSSFIKYVSPLVKGEVKLKTKNGVIKFYNL